MEHIKNGISRRTFVRSAAGAAIIGMTQAPLLHAASYPERALNFTVPTQAGGGADRDLRNFNKVWGKYIKADFSYDFFPGAAGRVGYEVYLGKRDPDCYNLLFGNIGPEIIMYVLQQPKYKYPGDYVYISQISTEPMAMFVRTESPFRTIEDMVAEGKKRTLNLAVTRLPHPASIGALALAEATGAKFNLVPFGGGAPAIRALLAGEVDGSPIPLGAVAQVGSGGRVLCVFDERNPIVGDTAPPVNKAFGTKIPPLTSSRAFAVHDSAVQKYPDRIAILKSSMKKVFDDPEYPESVKASGLPTAFINYGDQEAATASAAGILELAARYKPLLTGKKG